MNITLKVTLAIFLAALCDAFGLWNSAVIVNMVDLLDFLVLMDYHTKREKNLLILCRLLIIKMNE
jgi:hypothetical protein